MVTNSTPNQYFPVIVFSLTGLSVVLMHFFFYFYVCPLHVEETIIVYYFHEFLSLAQQLS